MKWLVACFEPFGAARTNASALMHARLKDRDWAGRVDFAKPLPVTFADAWPRLEQDLLARPAVDGILTLGQAAGRRSVDLECLALNRIDTTAPDNAGVTPPFGPVVAGGPEVRWCSVPWEHYAGDPLTARSYSAGTYVCNALFYRSLAFAEARGLRSAFIHVPALDVQQEFDGLPRRNADHVDAALVDILRFLLHL